MEVSGIGRVLFWESGSLWIGRVTAPIQAHAHHAIQIGIGLDGQVRFRAASDERWLGYHCAVVPPNLPHLMDASGRLMANILLEPESVAGRRIVAGLGMNTILEIGAARAQCLAGPFGAAFEAGAADDRLIELARTAVADIAGAEARDAPADPRILAAIDAIQRNLDEPLTLAGIARTAGLSEGRFRHLFIAQTGISFRGYVLWARLNRALSLGFGGTSWTEAAHAANFADSAHLSRTCRRMIGLAPTSIRQEDPQALGRRMA